MTNTNRNNLEIVAHGKLLPNMREFIWMLTTFSLTVLAWIFFRAENITHAFRYISEIFSISTLSIPQEHPRNIILLLMFFVLIEWLGRENQYAISHLGTTWKRPVRYAFYYAILIAIFWFGGKEQEFIYFQF